MKRKQIKFVVGSLVIILALSYLAYSGYVESKAYFQTVPEVYAMKDGAYDVRMKVSGDVLPGSIRHEGKVIHFVIGSETGMTLPVKYVGKDTPPDTFIDRATTVVDGKLGGDGVFVANSMTAKCASKYEKEAAAGVYSTKSEKSK